MTARLYLKTLLRRSGWLTARCTCRVQPSPDAVPKHDLLIDPDTSSGVRVALAVATISYNSACRAIPELRL